MSHGHQLQRRCFIKDVYLIGIKFGQKRAKNSAFICACVHDVYVMFLGIHTGELLQDPRLLLKDRRASDSIRAARPEPRQASREEELVTPAFLSSRTSEPR